MGGWRGACQVVHGWCISVPVRRRDCVVDVGVDFGSKVLNHKDTGTLYHHCQGNTTTTRPTVNPRRLEIPRCTSIPNSTQQLVFSTPAALAIVPTGAEAPGDMTRTGTADCRLYARCLLAAEISRYLLISPQTIAANLLGTLNILATISTSLWEASAAMYTVAILPRSP
ncbi:hypothetical protein F5146DRAFT_252864 [Armillaria mellea]|nr:hypothetical protein F5146DRAFT_252864 [Armillaria mellea]